MFPYNLEKARLIQEHMPTAGTIMETLGIKMSFTDDGGVVATMDVGYGHYQPAGLLHGGINVVIAESVASMGAHLYLDLDTQYAVGLEINANHLKSVRNGMIRAEGHPVHVGRNTQVWVIQIFSESGDLISISRCTLAVRTRERASDPTYVTAS